MGRTLQKISVHHKHLLMAELASEEEKQAVHVFLSHISRFKSTYESWKEARQASIATLRELVQTLNTTSKRVNLTNVTSASLGAPVGVAAVVSGALVLAAPFTGGVSAAVAGVVLAGAGVAGAVIGGTAITANLSHFGIKHYQRKKFNQIIEQDQKQTLKLQEARDEFLKMLPELCAEEKSEDTTSVEHNVDKTVLKSDDNMSTTDINVSNHHVAPEKVINDSESSKKDIRASNSFNTSDSSFDKQKSVSSTKHSNLHFGSNIRGGNVSNMSVSYSKNNTEKDTADCEPEIELTENEDGFMELVSFNIEKESVQDFQFKKTDMTSSILFSKTQTSSDDDCSGTVSILGMTSKGKETQKVLATPNSEIKAIGINSAKGVKSVGKLGYGMYDTTGKVVSFGQMLKVTDVLSDGSAVAGAGTKVATTMSKFATLAKVIQMGGIVFGAVGVIADVGSIVYYATEIHKGSPCDLADEIYRHSVILEKELHHLTEQCDLFLAECEHINTNDDYIGKESELN